MVEKNVILLLCFLPFYVAVMIWLTNLAMKQAEAKARRDLPVCKNNDVTDYQGYKVEGTPMLEILGSSQLVRSKVAMGNNGCSSIKIYEKCTICGLQAEREMPQGGGFTSSTCGHCGSDRMNIQIGGNQKPAWWKP